MFPMIAGERNLTMLKNILGGGNTKVRYNSGRTGKSSSRDQTLLRPTKYTAPSILLHRRKATISEHFSANQGVVINKRAMALETRELS